MRGRAPWRAATDVERAARLERPLVHQVRERLAIQVLHHQKDLLVAGLPEVGDVDDVLVIDAVGGARLAQEALAGGGVAGVAREQKLERDVAPDQLVPALVDDAHAARADELRDEVAPRCVRPTSDSMCAANTPATGQCARPPCTGTDKWDSASRSLLNPGVPHDSALRPRGATHGGNATQAS